MTMRDLQLPGRSPVFGEKGMCATSHPLGTEAAIGVLRRGGNAVDAAVTAAGVLAVVEQQQTGIGGDCFAVVARAGKAPEGFNGSGRAPAGARLEALTALGLSEITPESIHAVTLPGAIRAWETLLAQHGTIGLDEALQPAIRYARDGFIVAPRVAFDWRRNLERLKTDETMSALFLKRDGAPFGVGDRHANPALATTLETIAKQGARGFYEGAVADAMVRRLNALGGAHTLADFAAVTADPVAPVTVPYRGTDIVQLPPVTQGITVQLILNILENFDLAALEPLGAERFHLEIEAARAAYRVCNAHIADPGAMTVAVEDILDKALGRRLAGMIDPARRADGYPVAVGAGSDTTYLTVVDADWTAVSFINSLFHNFGSCNADPETGVVFHSRGSSFSLDPAHPNCLAPGKRPMHTIIPGLAMRGGRAELSFGVMGAAYQPVGQAHVITNIYDYGMDVQQAIDAPRAFMADGAISVERGIAPAVLAGLKEKGHEIVAAEVPWGGGQAIQLDWETGVLTGGSDPRKDGCALGF